MAAFGADTFGQALVKCIVLQQHLTTESLREPPSSSEGRKKIHSVQFNSNRVSMFLFTFQADFFLLAYYIDQVIGKVASVASTKPSKPHVTKKIIEHNIAYAPMV